MCHNRCCVPVLTTGSNNYYVKHFVTEKLMPENLFVVWKIENAIF